MTGRRYARTYVFQIIQSPLEDFNNFLAKALYSRISDNKWIENLDFLADNYKTDHNKAVKYNGGEKIIDKETFRGAAALYFLKKSEKMLDFLDRGERCEELPEIFFSKLEKIASDFYKKIEYKLIFSKIKTSAVELLKRVTEPEGIFSSEAKEKVEKMYKEILEGRYEVERG